MLSRRVESGAMQLIEWQKKFETGIAEVDFEHKSLVGLVNATLVRLGAAPGPGDARELLGEIDAKITAHFALEEKVMREAGYPGYAGHKADHERLLDEIREIMDMHEARRPAGQADLLAARLSAWFTDHFKTEDARFHAFVSGAQGRARA